MRKRKAEALKVSDSEGEKKHFRFGRMAALAAAALLAGAWTGGCSGGGMEIRSGWENSLSASGENRGEKAGEPASGENRDGKAGEPASGENRVRRQRKCRQKAQKRL